MPKDDVLFGYRQQLFAEAARTSVSAAADCRGDHLWGGCNRNWIRLPGGASCERVRRGGMGVCVLEANRG